MSFASAFNDLLEEHGMTQADCATALRAWSWTVTRGRSW